MPVVKLPDWIVGLFWLAVAGSVIAVLLAGPRWMVDIVLCLGLANVAWDGHRWWQRRSPSAT